MNAKILKQFYIRPLKKQKLWRHLRWWVIIVNDRRDVRRLYGRKSSDVAAFCRKRKDGRQCRVTRSIGVIVLTKRHGSQVITHESVHAAVATLAFMQTGRTWPATIRWNEEMLCQVSGNIACEIVAKCYQYGVWE